MPSDDAIGEVRNGLIVCLIDLAAQRGEDGQIQPDAAAKMRRAAEILQDKGALAELTTELDGTA